MLVPGWVTNRLCLFFFHYLPIKVGYEHNTDNQLCLAKSNIIRRRQEQNPIKNFAVPFLTFLSEFYAVFCVHQILILLPL